MELKCVSEYLVHIEYCVNILQRNVVNDLKIVK